MTRRRGALFLGAAMALAVAAACDEPPEPATGVFADSSAT